MTTCSSGRLFGMADRVGEALRRRWKDMVDDLHSPVDEAPAPEGEDAEPRLLTKEEAIDEVRRWFEQYRIDPNQIFARSGEMIVRYGDLIGHLEQDTEDGRLLLRAISRGRVIRQQRQIPGLEEDHPA